MATEAAENRILDVLAAAFATIGPVGATWNTDPSVTLEVPGDSLPESPVTQIYLAHFRTGDADDAIATGLTSHGYAATYAAYYVAMDPAGGRAAANRKALNLAKDGRQALYAAEASMEAIPEFMRLTVAPLERQNEAADAGRFMYGQQIVVEFEETHS